jgi:hypothetical protein
VQVLEMQTQKRRVRQKDKLLKKLKFHKDSKIEKKLKTIRCVILIKSKTKEDFDLSRYYYLNRFQVFHFVESLVDVDSQFGIYAGNPMVIDFKIKNKFGDGKAISNRF